MASPHDIIRNARTGGHRKRLESGVCNAIGTGITPQSMHSKLAVPDFPKLRFAGY